jgi:riboflavin synthase
MFTGIVEELGAIISIDKTLAGTRMTVLASAVMDDLTVGNSISVNGACLTVVNKTDHNFSVEISPETLSVTTLGQLAAGAPLNLERAMKLNERIGGHLVAGHVDGIGTVRNRQQDGNAILFTIEAPPEILRHCIVEGSVTVDGISLRLDYSTHGEGHDPRPQASRRSGQSRIGPDREIRRTSAAGAGTASRQTHSDHR